MARPMRNSARASGRFSSREIVDCEHSSRSDGARSSAILNMGSPRKTGGVVAVFIAGGDHQEPKTNDIGEAVRDLIGRAWVLDTRRHAIGDAKALFDLAQNQNTAVRRQQAAVEFGDNCLAGNR